MWRYPRIKHFSQRVIYLSKYRSMAIRSNRKFPNNKDAIATVFVESNESMEDIACGDVNIKQESGLRLVSKEVRNKPDGQLEKSNLSMGKYIDCTNETLEEDKGSPADITALIFLESNEITEDLICEDINIKQEEITIKLEESGLMLVNKEVGNKLDGQLEESNLSMGEYTDRTNRTLEKDKHSSPDIRKELRVELRNIDDFDSRSEDDHIEDDNLGSPRGQTNNLLEYGAARVGMYKIDELINRVDNGIGFDEKGVPVIRNGCKLTWQERQTVPVFCKPCNHSIQWKYYLVHRRRHLGDLRYSCDKCNKAFPAMYQLTAHKLIHMDEHLHLCDVCNKSFKQKYNLQKHKQIHNEERPYKCEICTISFKQLQGLKHHMLRHSKRKPYVCEYCGKSFIDAGSMSRHKIVHIEEKKHACSICGRKFCALSQLKEHENKTHIDHRPHCCSRCGRGFKTNGALKKHMLIHTGEKPYSCSICGKQFRHSECLPRHIRTHTGETPFHCEECPASFKHLHILKRHVKVHSSHSKINVQ